MTKRFLVLLLERALVELPLTKRAHKMLGMKFFVHGHHTSTVDGLLTRRAQAAAFEMVVEFAVGQRVVFEKTRRVKRRTAVLTNKTAGMPIAVQSRDEVVDDWFVASFAFGCQFAIVAFSFLFIQIFLTN